LSCLKETTNKFDYIPIKVDTYPKP
jgi:hypothetical protein